MVPNNEQCIQMLSDYHVPAKVQRHSFMVAQAAVHLAELINSCGYCLDVKEIEAAALLHDIARTQNDHAKTGADTLISKGYAQIAEIVRQHMKPKPEEQERISEITIVYLADKFVDGDKVVSLEQRFLEKKYIYKGKLEAHRSIEENYRIAQKLQGIIKDAIGYRGELYELFTGKNRI